MKQTIELTEDLDVTELLGVTQYVAPDPATMGGDAAGDMQNLGLLISDEERIENLNAKYQQMRKFRYYKTEKLEGTSFGILIDGEKFAVTGRKVEYKVPEEGTPVNQMNVYWKVAKQLDIENKLRKHIAQRDPGLVCPISLQGEIVGEGIQGNIYKLKGQTARFYNAFLPQTQEYLKFENFVRLITELGLATVPIIDDDYELPEDPNELLLDADTSITVFGNDPFQLAEGFVYVAKGEIPQGTKITRANFGRLSFKAKSRAYDLNKK
jgi:RNA ligase (TIGR02306 family)